MPCLRYILLLVLCCIFAAFCQEVDSSLPTNDSPPTIEAADGIVVPATSLADPTIPLDNVSVDQAVPLTINTSAQGVNPASDLNNTGAPPPLNIIDSSASLVLSPAEPPAIAPQVADAPPPIDNVGSPTIDTAASHQPVVPDTISANLLDPLAINLSGLSAIEPENVLDNASIETSAQGVNPASDLNDTGAPPPLNIIDSSASLVLSPAEPPAIAPQVADAPPPIDNVESPTIDTAASHQPVGPDNISANLLDPLAINISGLSAIEPENVLANASIETSAQGVNPASDLNDTGAPPPLNIIDSSASLVLSPAAPPAIAQQVADAPPPIDNVESPTIDTAASHQPVGPDTISANLLAPPVINLSGLSAIEPENVLDNASVETSAQGVNPASDLNDTGAPPPLNIIDSSASLVLSPAEPPAIVPQVADAPPPIDNVESPTIDTAASHQPVGPDTISDNLLDLPAINLSGLSAIEPENVLDNASIETSAQGVNPASDLNDTGAPPPLNIIDSSASLVLSPAEPPAIAPQVADAPPPIDNVESPPTIDTAASHQPVGPDTISANLLEPPAIHLDSVDLLASDSAKTSITNSSKQTTIDPAKPLLDAPPAIDTASSPLVIDQNTIPVNDSVESSALITDILQQMANPAIDTPDPTLDSAADLGAFIDPVNATSSTTPVSDKLLSNDSVDLSAINLEMPSGFDLTTDNATSPLDNFTDAILPNVSIVSSAKYPTGVPSNDTAIPPAISLAAPPAFDAVAPPPDIFSATPIASSAKYPTGVPSNDTAIPPAISLAAPPAFEAVAPPPDIFSATPIADDKTMRSTAPSDIDLSAPPSIIAPAIIQAADTTEPELLYNKTTSVVDTSLPTAAVGSDITSTTDLTTHHEIDSSKSPLLDPEVAPPTIEIANVYTTEPVTPTAIYRGTPTEADTVTHTSQLEVSTKLGDLVIPKAIDPALTLGPVSSSIPKETSSEGKIVAPLPVHLPPPPPILPPPPMVNEPNVTFKETSGSTTVEISGIIGMLVLTDIPTDAALSSLYESTTVATTESYPTHMLPIDSLPIGQQQSRSDGTGHQIDTPTTTQAITRIAENDSYAQTKRGVGSRTNTSQQNVNIDKFPTEDEPPPIFPFGKRPPSFLPEGGIGSVQDVSHSAGKQPPIYISTTSSPPPPIIIPKSKHKQSSDPKYNVSTPQVSKPWQKTITAIEEQPKYMSIAELAEFSLQKLDQDRRKGLQDSPGLGIQVFFNTVAPFRPEINHTIPFTTASTINTVTIAPPSLPEVKPVSDNTGTNKFFDSNYLLSQIALATPTSHSIPKERKTPNKVFYDANYLLSHLGIGRPLSQEHLLDQKEPVQPMLLNQQAIPQTQHVPLSQPPVWSKQQVPFNQQPLLPKQQVTFNQQPIRQNQEVSFNQQPIWPSADTLFNQKAIQPTPNTQQTQHVPFSQPPVWPTQHVPFNQQPLLPKQQVTFIQQPIRQNQEVSFNQQPIWPSADTLFNQKAIQPTQNTQQTQHAPFSQQPVWPRQHVPFNQHPLLPKQQVTFNQQPIRQNQEVSSNQQPTWPSTDTLFNQKAIQPTQNIQLHQQSLPPTMTQHKTPDTSSKSVVSKPMPQFKPFIDTSHIVSTPVVNSWLKNLELKVNALNQINAEKTSGETVMKNIRRGQFDTRPMYLRTEAKSKPLVDNRLNQLHDRRNHVQPIVNTIPIQKYIQPSPITKEHQQYNQTIRKMFKKTPNLEDLLQSGYQGDFSKYKPRDHVYGHEPVTATNTRTYWGQSNNIKLPKTSSKVRDEFNRKMHPKDAVQEATPTYAQTLGQIQTQHERNNPSMPGIVQKVPANNVITSNINTPRTGTEVRRIFNEHISPVSSFRSDVKTQPLSSTNIHLSKGDTHPSPQANTFQTSFSTLLSTNNQFNPRLNQYPLAAKIGTTQLQPFSMNFFQPSFLGPKRGSSPQIQTVKKNPVITQTHWHAGLGNANIGTSRHVPYSSKPLPKNVDVDINYRLTHVSPPTITTLQPAKTTTPPPTTITTTILTTTTSRPTTTTGTPPTADPNPPPIFDNKILQTFMPMPKEEPTTKPTNSAHGGKPAGWEEGSGNANSQFDNRCTNCIFVNDRCLLPDAEHCHMYIECVRQPGLVRAFNRECALGSFFDRKIFLCVDPKNANCPQDRCRQPGTKWYSIHGHCKHYWACGAREGGGAYAQSECCPDMGGFKEGEGCVQNLNCTESCTSVVNTAAPTGCKLRKTSSPTVYFDGNANMERPCAPGTLFNELHCTCVQDVTLERSQTKSGGTNCTCSNDTSCACRDATQASIGAGSCLPKLALVFEGGKNEDTSHTKQHIGIEGVSLTHGGEAIFNGAGRLVLWRHANLMFPLVFAVRFRFQSTTPEPRFQTLLSNCDKKDAMEPTFDISVDTLYHEVVFKVNSYEGSTKVFKIIYQENKWAAVDLIYDGERVVGSVDGRSRTILSGGGIESRPTPLGIGSCGGKGGFKGLMDDIYIYEDCIPDEMYGIFLSVLE